MIIFLIFLRDILKIIALSFSLRARKILINNLSIDFFSFFFAKLSEKKYVVIFNKEKKILS